MKLIKRLPKVIAALSYKNVVDRESEAFNRGMDVGERCNNPAAQLAHLATLQKLRRGER
jgi:hypothetical protein